MKFGGPLAIIVHVYSTIQFGVMQKLCIEHGPLIVFKKFKKIIKRLRSEIR